jgi:hypothetical protein
MATLDAKKIIEALAKGISPETGEELPAESALNDPQVIRALHAAAKALESAAKQQRRRNSLPLRAGSAWSDKEDNELLAEWDSGLDASEIAPKHQRTRSAIASRLVVLGRIKERGDANVRSKNEGE